MLSEQGPGDAPAPSQGHRQEREQMGGKGFPAGRGGAAAAER